ncbi:MAG: lysylphosphatidylglycerol synthase transmembrane domain-containing protein [Halanaerobium sp.]
MESYGEFDYKKYLYYFLIFLMISVSIFLILYFVFSQNNEIKILISFSLESIITLITLIVIYYTLDGIRLYYILKTLDYKLAVKDMYISVFLKYFISNVTPFSSGGGAAQIYYLQDTGAEAGKSTAAIVLRTVISTTILLLTAPLIMLSNQKFFALITGPIYILSFFIFFSLYIFIVYIMFFKNRFLKKIILRLLNFIKRKKLLSSKKYKKILKYSFKHLELFSRDIIEFMKQEKKSVVITIFLTFLFLITEYTFSYFLLRALGYYQIGYLNVIFLHTVIAFIMFFTPAPGAAGGAEAGFIFFYRNLVAKNDVLSLLFFWRFFTKYLGIFIGMLTFSYLVISNRRESN